MGDRERIDILLDQMNKLKARIRDLEQENQLLTDLLLKERMVG